MSLKYQISINSDEFIKEIISFKLQRKLYEAQIHFFKVVYWEKSVNKGCKIISTFTVMILLVDLQIRDFIKNALSPIYIQDCLQHKYWMSLFFIYHVKTDFKKFLFIIIVYYYYYFLCPCIYAVSAIFAHFLNKLFHCASEKSV